MDDLAFLTMHIEFLVPGALGGFVRLFFERKIKPRHVIGYVSVGAVAANFLAPPVLVTIYFLIPQLVKLGVFLQSPELSEFLVALFQPPLIAFLIGMCGLWICQRINKHIIMKVKQIEKSGQ